MAVCCAEAKFRPKVRAKQGTRSARLRRVRERARFVFITLYSMVVKFLLNASFFIAICGVEA